MVDFNNDATIGTPRTEILSVLILQRRNDVIEAIESFKKAVYQNSDGHLWLVRSRLLSLFLEVRSALRNSMPADKFVVLENGVLSENFSDLGTAFFTIDEWLYDKKITKIDTRKDVDVDDIEEVNRSHGM